MEDNELIQLYSFDEFLKLIKNKERLVYINDGIADMVGLYEDIPDIIVDFNRRFGSNDLTFYNFYGNTTDPIISTYGMFLNKCNSDVRKDIIDRLIKLQKNEEEIKKYKLIDEFNLEKYYEYCEVRSDGNER